MRNWGFEVDVAHIRTSAAASPPPRPNGGEAPAASSGFDKRSDMDHGDRPLLRRQLSRFTLTPTETLLMKRFLFTMTLFATTGIIAWGAGSCPAQESESLPLEPIPMPLPDPQPRAAAPSSRAERREPTPARRPESRVVPATREEAIPQAAQGPAFPGEPLSIEPPIRPIPRSSSGSSGSRLSVPSGPRLPRDVRSAVPSRSQGEFRPEAALPSRNTVRRYTYAVPPQKATPPAGRASRIPTAAPSQPAAIVVYRPAAGIFRRPEYIIVQPARSVEPLAGPPASSRGDRARLGQTAERRESARYVNPYGPAAAGADAPRPVYVPGQPIRNALRSRRR